MAQNGPGTIGWLDLTVADAPGVRDFYEAVTGWNVVSVDMGGYQDYCMVPPGSGEPIAGVCHAREGNESLPRVWLPYIIVENLEASMQACRDRGGEVVHGPKNFGPNGSYCIIRDPAGAHAGLFQAAPQHPAES